MVSVRVTFCGEGAGEEDGERKTEMVSSFIFFLFDVSVLPLVTRDERGLHSDNWQAPSGEVSPSPSLLLSFLFRFFFSLHGSQLVKKRQRKLFELQFLRVQVNKYDYVELLLLLPFFFFFFFFFAASRFYIRPPLTRRHDNTTYCTCACVLYACTRLVQLHMRALFTLFGGPAGGSFAGRSGGGKSSGGGNVTRRLGGGNKSSTFFSSSSVGGGGGCGASARASVSTPGGGGGGNPGIGVRPSSSSRHQQRRDGRKSDGRSGLGRGPASSSSRTTTTTTTAGGRHVSARAFGGAGMDALMKGTPLMARNLHSLTHHTWLRAAAATAFHSTIFHAPLYTTNV